MAGPSDAGDRLVVGRVVTAHGIRGECVVEVHSDAPGRFDSGSVVYAEDRTLTVEGSRPHKRRLLVAFREVPDRTAAEALRGVWLTIPSAEAAAPPEGTYYPHEIVGCAVRDTGGALLGTLADVVDNPAHDIWVVRTSEGREVMVPAVDEFVRSVDPDERLIVLAPIGGMFD